MARSTRWIASRYAITMQTHDYLRQIDLNPTVNGAAAPIMGPLDPRALCMFGFTATEQTIANQGAFPVFVSFDLAHDPAIPGAPMPQYPAVHLAIAPGQSRTLPAHARQHAIVWLDVTTGLPPMGVAVNVRVEARG